jgi:GNAT superfamily N-acetyltransferase
MEPFDTRTGYIPGLIGRIADLHGCYYAANWNFGAFFEAKVATGLSEFIRRYDEDRDAVWSLSAGGRIQGALAIDGTSEPPGTAHLRWFILSDDLRGRGAGNHLMERAMAFCGSAGYERVYLWTFKGLLAARHLYDKFGFVQVEELQGGQWGTVVTEQRLEKVIGT